MLIIPGEIINLTAYIAVLRQRYRQLRVSFTEDIKSDIALVDDDPRLREMRMLRSVIRIANVNKGVGNG